MLTSAVVLCQGRVSSIQLRCRQLHVPWGFLGHAACDLPSVLACAGASKVHLSAPLFWARRCEIQFGTSFCMTRIDLRRQASRKFTPVRLSSCGGCRMCHESGMATPQTALRAFPLAGRSRFLTLRSLTDSAAADNVQYAFSGSRRRRRGPFDSLAAPLRWLHGSNGLVVPVSGVKKSSWSVLGRSGLL